MTPAVLKAGLNALHYSGVSNALAPMTRGLGVIFMMHHIRPACQNRFDPNGLLAITPNFLAAAVRRVRARGWDIVSIEEATARLQAPAHPRARPFAAFTIDDGYRDNLEYAYPIMKAADAPFTVYLTSALPDGTAELWWIGLEQVIARNPAIEVAVSGATTTLVCDSPAAKQEAWARLYPLIRNAPEDDQRAIVRDLCARYGVSLAQICAELAMTWDEVRQLASDPLVTIGAHTVNHFAVAKLSPDQVRAEMDDGARKIEAETGRRPRHFAYPYGDPWSAGQRDFEIAKELGFASAVTTRKGMLTAEHGAHLFALPRVALNGNLQSLRYVDVLLSGAPFFLFNGFRMSKTA
jgi:peptidoglycan/xylan/chitin deacetylase (PgdA/CDA1 family)